MSSKKRQDGYYHVRLKDRPGWHIAYLQNDPSGGREYDWHLISFMEGMRGPLDRIQNKDLAEIGDRVIQPKTQPIEEQT